MGKFDIVLLIYLAVGENGIYNIEEMRLTTALSKTPNSTLVMFMILSIFIMTHT
jgi:hypothetical protein